MTDEDEVRGRLKVKPVDTDLVLDPSMYGRYRGAQIERWRNDMFMFRSVNAMSNQDVLDLRRKELIKQHLKEGTPDDGEAQDPVQ